MFTFADPVELWLEVSADLQATAWRFASYSSAANHWNGYINQVCLEALLSWLRSEQAPQATAGLTDRAAIWEVVNGSVIEWEGIRLAIIPTEAIDDAELAVPQEWVDIPDWAADYYLAVQIDREPSLEHASERDLERYSPSNPASDPATFNEEESATWIRVWGYAPYQIVKSSPYDPTDRTYNVDATALTRDWSALWVTLQYCPIEPPQVAALPALTNADADRLLQRLADQPFPRLSIPFDRWGALLQHPTWRQQLYRFRTQGLAGLSPDRVNLGEWLQQRVSEGWQSLESVLGRPEWGWGLRSIDSSPSPYSDTLPSTSSESAPIAPQAKSISLGNQENQTVALAIQLTPEAEERIAVVVQVYPMDQAIVPAGLRLSLLDETGEVLQTVEAGSQDSLIQLRRFRAPLGTAFQVAVELDRDQVIEQFVL
ncbi:MAG: DUF1822 family protein [Elainella sp. Prado103]|nr:DUF1822 family protein [Elainella sp. Prado103]